MIKKTSEYKITFDRIKDIIDIIVAIEYVALDA